MPLLNIAIQKNNTRFGPAGVMLFPTYSSRAQPKNSAYAVSYLQFKGAAEK
jgi:hypothetical protein